MSSEDQIEIALIAAAAQILVAYVQTSLDADDGKALNCCEDTAANFLTRMFNNYGYFGEEIQP